MLFYMNGKTFLQTYLDREEDWRILDAFYVIMSDSIRVSDKTKYNTIMYAPKYFYPMSEVLFASEWEEYKTAYKYQLKDAKSFLATLIHGSLTKGYNIIFLYSEKERKEKYPKVLAQYIMEEFKYPVYDYLKYIKGKCKICEYDPDEVFHIVKPIVDELEKMERESPDYKIAVREKIKKWPKKKLKKKLEEFVYYVEKESKQEMLALYLSLTADELPMIDQEE